MGLLDSVDQGFRLILAPIGCGIVSLLVGTVRIMLSLVSVSFAQTSLKL